MPGYIIHLAEAEIMIRELQNRGYDMAFSEQWKERFRYGCLLPDAAPKEKKAVSHFWNSAEPDTGITLPDMECFVVEYSSKLMNIEKNPEAFGYYIHLYLDGAFFSSYLKSCVRLLDDAGNTVETYSKAKNVQILKSGEEIPLRCLFSQEYLYGDYTKLNQYLMRKYSILIPKIETENEEDIFGWPLSPLLEQLTEFLKCDVDAAEELRVLEVESLEEFLLKAASTAIREGEGYYGCLGRKR